MAINPLTAQEKSTEFQTKTYTLQNDTLQIETKSINPNHFVVKLPNGTIIDSSKYHINFKTAQLVVNSQKHPHIVIEYLNYPHFLTKTYSPYNENKPIPTNSNIQKLYSPNQKPQKKTFQLFEGLHTKGSISRNLTIGSNQDAVLNSSLNLKISGKLSKKVSLNASIVDTDIPIHEAGYTQNTNEFDNVFIELASDKWKLKAGDLFLNNRASFFLNFNKRVSGVELTLQIPLKTNTYTNTLTPQKPQGPNTSKHPDTNKIEVIASGALVRGQFFQNNITGIEGNQGPYQLTGPQNRLAILLVPESETIYINGEKLKKGPQHDYTIDYNTGEFTFNPTFPITSEMRIVADFQYADRNYSRFMTYDKASFKNKKLEISTYFYNESDLKNQPIQQNLSDTQKQLLANAGDDPSQMIAPSAFLDTYDSQKILYTKETLNTTEIFVFSNNPNEPNLYNVTFHFVGTQAGNYQLKDTIATGKIYEFAGNNLGDYSPVTQLIAPEKLQIAVVSTHYQPSEKTTINTELAHSNNDLNQFSTLNDNNNQGFATKIGVKQQLLNNKWKLFSHTQLDYINKNFTSVENLYNVEFNRDWNLTTNTLGNQLLFNTSFLLANKNSNFSYIFEKLTLGENFKGNKHSTQANFNIKKTHINAESSYLKATNLNQKNTFARAKTLANHKFEKSWLGGGFEYENNQFKNLNTNNLLNTSHQFSDFHTFFGLGDSSAVFAEFKATFRTTDSIHNAKFTQASSAKTFALTSQLIKTKNTNLFLFANYRTVNNSFHENSQALNTKATYQQKLFKNSISWNITYETSSGSLPQQEFIYIKTEPGQGYYTWIDYNSNGLQEYNEFEVAQFQDQATYLRVSLPTLTYLKTSQAKISQVLHINPIAWNQKTGFKKLASHFSNQLFALVDNKQERQSNKFIINPFNIHNNKLLGLRFNLKNNLYFNRGLQKYSTTYSYSKSHQKNISNQETLENQIKTHQLKMQHKLSKFWLAELKGTLSNTQSNSDINFNRNYFIETHEFQPKLSYIFNNNTQFDVFYEYKNKENTLGTETLQWQQLGINFIASNPKKGSVNANFSFYNNIFNGLLNAPVSYQMLEGLQNGKNLTWNLLMQKKLNTFLYLNINYSGRKNETSKAIHTGSMQLKAKF